MTRALIIATLLLADLALGNVAAEFVRGWA